ncbi:MAG: FAD-dependent thymidylate synthase [Candidatus Dormibacteria bacterium]
MSEPYWVESFTATERARLSPHVSNLDGPVFTLRDLPQVTCAALFARYSRSPKSLRRLLLDEFLDIDPSPPGARPDGDPAAAAPAPDTSTAEPVSAGPGGERAGRLFSRVLAEYGDDSVAQLAGVHLACEQVSQPLAKAIEWGRLAGYLEQSTRYIPYTDRRSGHYRYRRDPVLLASPHAGGYLTAMDGLFDTYSRSIEPLCAHLGSVVPAESDPRAHRRAVRALALDMLRGLLPAGTVSNVGMFASPQALEHMVLRLRTHPLPEARQYAELVAAELRVAIPDFVTRLDRPERGGVWADYLRETAASLGEAAATVAGLPVTANAAPESPLGAGSRTQRGTDGLRPHLLPPNGLAHDGAEAVTLVDWDRDGESDILAAALHPYTSLSHEQLRATVAGLEPQGRAELFRAAAGQRLNRRHRPGRGFEHCEYTFEVVSDYGAFRDLQRHRLMTIQWQELTPALGYAIPAAVEAAGLAQAWRDAVDGAEAAWAAIRADLPQEAGYLVTLGHRLRYLIRLNAREAMHLIELRTSPQGHPEYRRICQEMHRLIDTVAGHHLVAESMRFVNSEDVHLPRYAAEATRPERE